MKNFGFITVGAAIPSVKVADVDYNIAQIKGLIDKAVAQGVEILCFPELSVTGYTCQDLFHNIGLLEKSDAALLDLTAYCRNLPIAVIVGAPVRKDNRLFNSAVIISGGTYYTVNKTHLSNRESDEQRWFSAEKDNNPPVLFETPSGAIFAVELSDDLLAPIPPSSYSASAGADLVFNLSASQELIGSHSCLKSLISQQSARCMAGYIYSSAGFGESTQDVVYGGNAFIYENGEQLAESRRFSMDEQLIVSQIDIELLRAERLKSSSFAKAQLLHSESAVLIPFEHRFEEPKAPLSRTYSPYPFIPEATLLNESCEEVFNIQVMGLAKRLIHTNCKNAVIGISGGLDSTLALLVCVKTFDKLGLDRKGIHGITMPGFGTTDRTHDNAVSLMESLGITSREISIVPAVKQHFADLGHDISNHDVTYENSQARYRTMLLMDIANQVNGMVIGTGDLSELALGWCTYNGDHMSMYAVNASVPKTLIRPLVKHVADELADEKSRNTLLDIIDTPISPELIPADEAGNIKQKTEDIVGPYELHDFFLYYFVRFGFTPEKIQFIAERAFDGSNGPEYDSETISKWLSTFMRRFRSQQFKRSCMPDGPQVGAVSLSPRGGWKMPSDASMKL